MIWQEIISFIRTYADAIIMVACFGFAFRPYPHNQGKAKTGEV